MTQIVLAPMEGVVDWVLRDLITEIGGVDLCVTEFIRVTESLLPERVFLDYCPELRTASRTRSGTPVLVQFLGSDPQWVAENAFRAAELGAFGIDLNFGCPAKTVNRHDGGASLLKDPCRIFEMVSTVRKRVPQRIGVSAKVRLGFSHKEDFLKIAQAAEDGGASFLTVHARTRDDGYRPPAYWEYIARIRETVKIPVIANGEIWSEGDFARCREVTGCTMFMLGRGLIADPDLAARIQGGKGLSPSELGLVFLRFLDGSEKFVSAAYAVSRAKQWAKQLARSCPEWATLFETIKRLQTLPEVVATTRDFCYNLEKEGSYGQSENVFEIALPVLRSREEHAQKQRC